MLKIRIWFSKATPPTLLFLLLLGCLTPLFTFKNAILAIPIVIIATALWLPNPPDKWHPLGTISLNLMLSLLAFLATLNPVLCILIDFLTTYLLVFLLNDTETSKNYFGFGFAFVIYQSFSITPEMLVSRELTILTGFTIAFIFTGVYYVFKKGPAALSIIPAMLNPLLQLKEKSLRLIKGMQVAVHQFYILFIFRILKDKTIDTTTFVFHKTRFAFRIALLLTFTFALEHFLGIPKGYWLPLNVFIMTLNYYEDSVIKTRERILGNILGVILSIGLLHFAHGFPAHILILILGIFFAYAVNAYIFRATYMACCAIAISTLYMPEADILTLRLLYVLLAATIAILGSRFIFSNQKE